MKDVQSAQVTVAATQMPCGWNVDANLVKAENIVREAAAKGAQIILLQELFEHLLIPLKKGKMFRVSNQLKTWMSKLNRG